MDVPEEREAVEWAKQIAKQIDRNRPAHEGKPSEVFKRELQAIRDEKKPKP